MPTLKHLLEELRKIDVDPDEIRIPGQLFDDLLDQGEDIAEETRRMSKSPSALGICPSGRLIRG